MFNKYSRYFPVVLIVFFLVLLILIGLGIAFLINNRAEEVKVEREYTTFTGCRALANWMNEAKKKSSGGYPYYFEDFGGSFAPTMNRGVAEDSATGSKSYSTTNVQVAGVDEADIIKTDGDYIYAISASNNYYYDSTNKANSNDVHIIKVTNGNFDEVAKIDIKGIPSELFLSNNKLVIYANESRNFTSEGSGKEAMPSGTIYPDYYGGSQSVVAIYVYDVTNKELPKFERKVSVEGTYLTSRMVNGVTYLVSNFYTRLYDTDINENNVKNFLPQISDSKAEGLENYSSILDCNQIARVGEHSSQFLSVVAVPIDGADLGKELLLTNAENVYASKDNLYVVNTVYPQTNYPYPCGLFGRVFAPDSCMPTVSTSSDSDSQVMTGIYKFRLGGTDISYVDSAEVIGTLLNQFSMDEYKENFRIAVTNGEVWNERKPSQSILYIFDKSLNEISKIEGLGKGERIYSVRFMGDRAYVVTFKKVDPFYVLDLSNANSPKVLGELKIPGYSDYLHPYDENHVIGIGKNAVDAETGSFAWYQGLKMALFDVTDPTNPKEKYKVEIGDRGSESEVLNNHKAFLFDKAKELLVIPASVAKIEDKSKELPGFSYGKVDFRGFLVYRLTSTQGFSELGRVDSGKTEDYWWYGSQGSRSLYIDNVLITFTNSTLRSNSLYDIQAIDSIELK